MGKTIDLELDKPAVVFVKKAHAGRGYTDTVLFPASMNVIVVSCDIDEHVTADDRDKTCVLDLECDLKGDGNFSPLAGCEWQSNATPFLLRDGSTLKGPILRIPAPEAAGKLARIHLRAPSARQANKNPASNEKKGGAGGVTIQVTIEAKQMTLEAFQRTSLGPTVITNAH